MEAMCKDASTENRFWMRCQIHVFGGTLDGGTVDEKNSGSCGCEMYDPKVNAWFAIKSVHGGRLLSHLNG